MFGIVAFYPTLTALFIQTRTEGNLYSYDFFFNIASSSLVKFDANSSYFSLRVVCLASVLPFSKNDLSTSIRKLRQWQKSAHFLPLFQESQSGTAYFSIGENRFVFCFFPHVFCPVFQLFISGGQVTLLKVQIRRKAGSGTGWFFSHPNLISILQKKENKKQVIICLKAFTCFSYLKKSHESSEVVCLIFYLLKEALLFKITIIRLILSFFLS